MYTTPCLKRNSLSYIEYRHKKGGIAAPKLNFHRYYLPAYYVCTGKSLSEALIFASTNPKYYDRLFIELQVQYMKIPSSNLGRTCSVQKLFLTFRTIFVHNMFSPCSAKIASDKDLPVHTVKKRGRFRKILWPSQNI